MTWVRLDDRMHDNRRVKRLWLANRPALALYFLALTYCGAHETDGVIDREFVELLAPVKREREAMTGALVEAGLWDQHEDGWLVDSFLDYNPSRAELEERRRKDSERKARGRATQGKRGVRKESARTPGGGNAESDGPVPARPVPTRTPKPKGSTTVDKGADVEPQGKGYLEVVA